MIFDIRGTHGSGKSWIVHQLLKKFDFEPVEQLGIHLGYYSQQLDTGILGKYRNICGGCDGIKSADEVCRRVRLFKEKYHHTILEGILVSHTFKRYHELAEELGDYTFLFLDTPEEVCIARVRKRRFHAGRTKPFNPFHLKNDYRQIWTNVRVKMGEAGHNIVVLNHRDPMPQVLELLNA